MAFNRPTLTQLRDTAIAEINALVAGADARLRFSVLNVLARVWAALVDGLHASLVYLSRQLFTMTATREFLTLDADSYGVYRLPAQAAAGCATVQGTAGTPIPIGTVLQRADGVQYRTTQGAVIPFAGYIDVPVIAMTLGVVSNAAPAVQLQPTTTIAGLTAAQVCADGIAGGSDEESAL